jgi:hypothetical protein
MIFFFIGDILDKTWAKNTYIFGRKRYCNRIEGLPR